MNVNRRQSLGYSLVEVLTAMGIIALLLAILLPTLQHVRGNATWAKSRSNMRQVYTYMQMYWTDNRQYIPPSLFDYSASPSPGKVRTQSPPGSAVPVIQPYNLGEQQGTWSDILWTYHKLGPVLTDGTTYDYRYDSPDKTVYDTNPDFTSVFRSPAPVLPSLNINAKSESEPGYYAANNYFDSRPGVGAWHTIEEIIRPSQSMYLIDSVIGEVIEDEPAPFAVPQTGSSNPVTLEVDFRYVGGICNILFLDGNIGTQNPWKDLKDLELNRQIRVVDLDKKSPDRDSL